MSVRVMTHVFENAEATANDRVVLLVLADHAHDDGAGAYPSQGTIAKKARISARTVRDCLARLEASGEIERTGDRHGRTRQLIEYRVTVRRQDSPPSETRQADAPKAAAPRAKVAAPRSERRQRAADEPLVEPSGEPPEEGVRADARRLCEFLTMTAGEAARPYPAAQLEAAAWLLDNVNRRELRDAVTWASGRTYWAPRVRTAGKLRRAWADLRVEWRAASGHGGRGRGVGPSSGELRARAAALREEGR